MPAPQIYVVKKRKKLTEQLYKVFENVNKNASSRSSSCKVGKKVLIVCQVPNLAANRILSA